MGSIRLAMSRIHGAEWKALISPYMTAIPFIGDAAEQSASSGPLPPTLLRNAMTASVGAAAKDSHSVAPELVGCVFIACLSTVAR